jgi:hypothetical protein
MEAVVPNMGMAWRLKQVASLTELIPLRNINQAVS